MNLFTDHPRSVGESYLEHMWVALSFAGALGAATLAALVHAVFPFLCKRTASETIVRLHQRMTRRR
jgi:hypothetical protein